MIMKNKELVSIIIPVYNVRPYLEEALNSVLRQTYTNLEILLIDDGSTDGSGEVCDEYACRDNRIHVIHQRNHGLSAARNAGLDVMTGDLTAFLDPDDAYADSFIEVLLNTVMTENVDLAMCGYTTHHTTGPLCYPGNGKDQSLLRPGLYDRADALRALVDNALNVGVWNKLYRRDLWRDLRFPDGHVYEDLDITYRIFDHCHSLRCLDQPLYLHRQRAGSITHTVSVDNIRDWHLAMAHFESYIAANIPAIFTSDQLRRHRQKRLSRLIVDYATYVSSLGTCRDPFAEKLKKKIFSFENEADIQNCSRRIRAARHMILACPELLRPVYRIYHPVRSFISKVTGR